MADTNFYITITFSLSLSLSLSLPLSLITLKQVMINPFYITYNSYIFFAIRMVVVVHLKLFYDHRAYYLQDIQQGNKAGLIQFLLVLLNLFVQQHV